MVISIPTAAAAADEIRALRERMHRMTDGVPRMPLDTHPALSGVVQLRTGGAYEVDSTALALALMAGPSRAGAWCAVVGVPDLGAEAAAEVGVELGRTVLVPEPGDLWLEATAALVDVAQVVVVRPPGRVAEHLAEKLGARLRKRGAVLVACGPWPRAEVRLSATESRWTGVGRGEGALRARRLVVEARRGAAPARRTSLWFPALDAPLRRAETAPEAASETLAPVREAG
ncbi:hypothetical protein [Nocardioides pantholopis]|uniref:hypothetical protein n=1 Tax=Nocardioides pantholopis TaxID=2483798 RepID=UPI001F155842|nr:hypothetical protein [Nocardioides pantholopis]